MRLLTPRAAFLVDNVYLPEATQVEDAEWEAFQLQHLNDDGVFRIEDKSRQIAWSWTVAAEAIADAVLHDAFPTAEGTVFVSINLEEAREKIRYAKRVYESICYSAGLPKITAHNVLGLEFDNGYRILSLPSRPPRGKARMHVVLDEFAHVQHDRQIYAAALPIISKGGRLRMGSSPMGASGVFWEVSQQELQAYPGFERIATPWFNVKSFCNGDSSGAAQMDTLDRVLRFGNERIQAMCGNMVLEDFQQEYECVYVDEKVSYFPWDMIRKNQDENLVSWHIHHVDDAVHVATEMKAAIAAKTMEPFLVGGVDVGRKRNLTEAIFLGLTGKETPVRLAVSLDKVKFEDQETCLRHFMSVLPVALLYIDQNGIGMQLAENLGRNTPAQGQTFTNASKAMWATEMRIKLDQDKVPLPVDRDLAYQIHSIKRKVTSSNNVVFDTDANEKHHADKMWALALALWAARECQGVSTPMKIPQWERR